MGFLTHLAVAVLALSPLGINAHAITRRQDNISSESNGRERISINKGWKFQRWTTNPDGLGYQALKAWILPSANEYIQDASQRHRRPGSASPGSDVPFVESGFDDGSWESVDLPHDWAIKGPFETGPGAMPGDMGRLPSYGIGWYRQTVTIAPDDVGAKTFYLDVDGAMSYAIVWLNGELVGGWPYGYNSFRLDLTPFVTEGENQLSIRLENPRDSSRWYPGGGIYRNVWLTTVHHVHVPRSGTFVTFDDVSDSSATISLSGEVRNNAAGAESSEVMVETHVHLLEKSSGSPGEKVAEFPSSGVSVSGDGETKKWESSVTVSDPQLWGPPPEQAPNMYVAVTRLSVDGKVVDTYETPFGIRSMAYTADGFQVNGHQVELKGVCQHHDLGALGSAFNFRAAQRQLEKLQEMGSNAIRTSHNPPAPELLQLADEMGFVVLDEIFDVWRVGKRGSDFHLIFDDWHEADIRSFVRRDRNHPSVFAWSFGNEIPEQTSADGLALGRQLGDLAREEDPTRPSTLGMNTARPNDGITGAVDLVGLNYQGEGVGNGRPQFPDFRDRHPGKMIFSTESSSTVTSRDTYYFPVSPNNNAPLVSNRPGSGADPNAKQISDYGLAAPGWGTSPDRTFAAYDQFPYAAGQFVWTGWDYLGEPTPYENAGGARSSYFGIIDLAGFPKSRFYQYQQQWRPDLPMAHILPHWNWAGREGQVTPVHVFSAADEAELFLNGESLGRQVRAPLTYRFRWDNARYQPGELTVVTYRDGSDNVWANSTVRTTGGATRLRLTPDRSTIFASGGGANHDLSFVTVDVVDDRGDVVPDAGQAVSFEVSGPGEIVATDNGDATDLVIFSSTTRKAFRGKALVIVRPDRGGGTGLVNVTATADGLPPASVTLRIE